MTPERWQEIAAAFHGALAQDVASRAAFLDQACAGDQSLRGEVDALLAAHDDAGRFGDAPLIVSASGSGQATLQANAPEADATVAEPPLARTPHHAFVWIIWFVSVTAAAAFAYSGLVIVKGESPPTFGWTEERRGDWRVATVDPSGPAAGRLKPGDRLVSLNGDAPAARAGTQFQRRALSVGSHYTLTVDRDGDRQEHRLIAAADPGGLTRQLTYFLIGLVWCVVGAFIGFARPEQSAARLASAAAAATGLGYLGAVTQVGPLWQPMHIVLGYHFFYRFPTDRGAGGVWKFLLGLLYLCGAPGAALGLWLQWTLLAHGPTAATMLMAQHVTLFVVLRASLAPVTYGGAVLGMVALLVRNYRRLTDEDARRRIRWVSVSSILALVLQLGWIAVDLFEAFVGRPSPVKNFNMTTDVFSLLIPVSVAYAVVKHRVLDIRVVVRRGVQYLLARRALQALMALPIAALVYTVAINRNQTIAQLASNSTAYLYWTGAAGLALRFRRPVGRWLDRRFFREEYDREQVLLVLLDDLSKVESISEMSRLISVELQSALHPKAVYLWHREPDTLTLAYSSEPSVSSRQFPGGVDLLSWLEARAAPASLPLPAEARLSRAEARRFAELGASLIVPITDSRERLVGVLMLGEKQSEEPYSASDRRLLQTIAQQAAVVRDNLRLRAQVSEEQRIRHDVLARLDGHHLNILKECPACGACYDSGAEHCDRDGQRLALSLPVARTIDDRYRLDRLIGKGGMGAVYEARDLRLGRIVAVKVMLGRAFGQQVSLRRFGREARSAARLNHPNIISVYDFGRLEGEGAYLVMELVQGITLRAELDRGALRPSEAAEWFDQLLDGLAAAHAHGIVHRDLKPENVMGQRGGSGSLVIKILDFGLAKTHAAEEMLVSGTVTAEGAVMGTAGYMSPEQILGREVDHRTDIFAVGVMVAEVLAGQRPFRGDTYADVSRAVLEGGYHLPGSTPEAQALDDVLQRCLAKDPLHRFSSSAALRDALVPAVRAWALT